MAGCRELMDGTGKLHEAGFWLSAEKVFDSTSYKAHAHAKEHQRPPNHPDVIISYSPTDRKCSLWVKIFLLSA